MNFETILTIIFGLLTVVGAGLSYYLYVKNKILTNSSAAINTAEDSDKFEAEKMDIAVQEIMKLLPAGAKIFFTEARVRLILQVAFDGIELFARKQLDKDN